MKQLLAISILLLCSSLNAQWWTLAPLIADTLEVPLADSLSAPPARASQVLDHRSQDGSYLGIRQIKKLNYIPVDQYLLSEYPLADYLDERIDLADGHSIAIEHLDIWYKSGPPFKKGWRLNGYTRELDPTGETIRDWQWAIRVKKIRKEELEQTLGRLVNNWMDQQNEVLGTAIKGQISPHKYRRQLVAWADVITLYDGSYIIDVRLCLPYPNDQDRSYLTSHSSMYYRRGKYHESVSIGGKDYQRFTRLSNTWVLRQNGNFRMGGNSFDAERFGHLDWWNILLVNASLTATLEYRPPYLMGLYTGAGLHLSYNFLPTAVTQATGGLVMSVGVMLP